MQSLEMDVPSISGVVSRQQVENAPLRGWQTVSARLRAP